MHTSLGLMGLGGKIQYVDPIPAYDVKDTSYPIPANSIITHKIQSFSVPVAIKLMLDINKKTGKALKYLLADTALFMRLLSILLVIGLLV